jgi:uncharacterized protein (DUF885 family)
MPPAQPPPGQPRPRFSEAELGEKLDVRRFHDKVLGAGALPLSIREHA